MEHKAIKWCYSYATVGKKFGLLLMDIWESVAVIFDHIDIAFVCNLRQSRCYQLELKCRNTIKLQYCVMPGKLRSC